LTVYQDVGAFYGEDNDRSSYALIPRREMLTRNFSHIAKKRPNAQPLHEDRKGDDSKTDGNDFFAPGNFRRKSKRKRKR